jgi:hypothetical protein
MFYEITIDSWINSGKLLDLMKKKVGIWIFRGQEDKIWNLSTRFERDAERYACRRYFFSNRERYILAEFQRRAHLFEQKFPDLKDSVEWLSYLQHYGGSTRLLDFTDSFYVAAFFSMETSVVDSAVWAVNLNNLMKSPKFNNHSTYSPVYELEVQRHKELANACIDSKEKSEDLVLVIDPFLQHNRLWMQQGLFLFPCNRESSFEKNLCSTFELSFESLLSSNAETIKMAELEQFDFTEVAILKIIIPMTMHPKTLYDLRDMNITPATLFPGLDGFARSLNLLMRRFEESF